ncbi:MAG: NADH:flavin oxidoreductase/NADH oxidase [Firmicutes bacterium]|nr:NADH:flavin oxidoreductase/NADH oxidase [Bacillota bacterium]
MAGLFDPLTLRSLTLKNRIVLSPMCQYQAGDDGQANSFHLVHYGARALGQAGLLLMEATAVEKRGRISAHDLGLWEDSQVEPLRRVVEFVHQQGAAIGVQLAHAGRKAECGMTPVAPSAIPFSPDSPTPQALAAEEIPQIVAAFQAAARRAVAAGCDTVEIHAAHGYLLHQFLSPLSNHRADAYGGSLANRCRLHLEVVDAIRRAIPDTMPLFMRVSASEYSPAGYSLEEVIELARLAQQHGVDVVDVSSGGNLPTGPRSWPGYQVPFAAAIREQARVKVMAVGRLEAPDLAEAVLQSGKADLVAIGRGFLRGPHWALTAALQLGTVPPVPEPYRRGYPVHPA